MPYTQTINMIKTIFIEDWKRAIMSWKIFAILAISAILLILIYASGLVLVGYLLFFKPTSDIYFPITFAFFPEV